MLQYSGYTSDIHFAFRLASSKSNHRLVHDLQAMIYDEDNKIENKKIIQSFILSLLPLTFEVAESSNSRDFKEWSNNLMEEISILLITSEKVCTNDIYRIVLESNVLNHKICENFLTNQLVSILRHNPDIPVTEIIKEQRKFKSVHASKPISQLFVSVSLSFII